MGEKEIKPADPKQQDSIPGHPDELPTRERPGTGTTPPPNPPTNKGGGGGSGRPSSSGGGGHGSGHVEFEDGFKMGRDESGNTFLQHPDGARATWDPGSETWTHDSDGKTASDDWSRGHRPTDFGPKH